jgi:hypothetical protein
MTSRFARALLTTLCLTLAACGSDSRSPGCNPVTGQGCACKSQGQCPVSTDTCSTITDSSHNTIGGGFCANTCSDTDKATTCALKAGQPGTGVCALELQTGTHCLVACGMNNTCPVNFKATNVMDTSMATACVCIPPS